MPTFRELSGLEDVFPRICEDLAAGRPFAFSRFGDGELRAIAGREGANCDGHQYFPDMGERLRQILASEPRYLLATLPRLFVEYKEEIAKLAGNVTWVCSLCMRDAVAEGRFAQFFEALRSRRVVLVGPPHLRPVAERQSWSILEVAPKNCWLEYPVVKQASIEQAEGAEAAFLFCASMMSNVLIDDLHRLDPRHAYVDVGSALDPYAGVKSRPYHDHLTV
jgi:hypothetical protein